MRITLELDQSVEENASAYFERAKKAKRKQQGAREALAETQKLLAKETQKTALAEQRATRTPPPKHWYHKYRWSKTRNGHLLVAGQNASANEVLIKHHTQEEDLVFHTDMAGSPFTILKPEGGVMEEDLFDAAVFTASYSKAWSKGLASLDVFYVKPHQVTKQAQAGEYLAKGSFMIRGETTYLSAPLELGVGVIVREGVLPEVFVGSKESCAQHTHTFALLIPGDQKTSDVAKQLRKRFDADLNDLVRAIPAGNSKIRI